MKHLRHALVFGLMTIGLILCLSGCTENNDTTPEQPVSQTTQTRPQAETKTPAADTATPQPAAQAPATATSVSGNPIVVLETSKGNITIELWPDKAPATVENFLTYVRDGFYGGTIFHRVISGFMIQGGGFTPDMAKKTTQAPIKNEAAANLPNERGTIAMARTNAPDSATSQFFINHRDNAMLNYRGPANPGYAVFGKVIDGMNVVDAIAAVSTTTKGPYQNVPAEPVVIEKARVVNP